MSVQRKDGARGPRWEVRWLEGDRHRSRTLRSEEEALALQAEILRRQRMGAFAPQEPSSMPLREFLAQWFRTSGPEWSPTTLSRRGPMVDKWIDPYIGHVPLRDLGRARVREWRADIMRDGCRPTNTQNVVRVLSAALGVAESDGLIPINPCLRLPPVKQQTPERRALPEDDLMNLIDLAPTPTDSAFIALMGIAGLRPAEVVALQWGDIDGGVIHVHASVQDGERRPTKNGKPRAVPVEPALDLVLAQAGGNPEPAASDLVTPASQGGFVNYPMWARRVWRPLCAATGIGKTAPYTLRHTAISRWIAQGNDLMTVAAWAGHGSAEMTLRHYAHLFERARRRAA